MKLLVNYDVFPFGSFTGARLIWSDKMSSKEKSRRSVVITRENFKLVRMLVSVLYNETEDIGIHEDFFQHVPNRLCHEVVRPFLCIRVQFGYSTTLVIPFIEMRAFPVNWQPFVHPVGY